MRLYIRNMMCVRCSLVVKYELEKRGIELTSSSPGEIEIAGPLSEEKLLQLKLSMQQLGLELIDDRESIIIEKIKTEIIRLISDNHENARVKFSDHLSSRLGYSYHYLSTLFSTVHGSSIERYYIQSKIDRVKEMLIHNNLSFSEIAFNLHYSSVAHLSGQFKKETGLTLSQFRKLDRNKPQKNGHR